MPHTVIHLSGAPDAALARRAADTVADLTQRVLGKQLPVIATAVQFVADDQWFVGGESLAALGMDESEIAGVLGENMARVARQVWSHNAIV